MAVFVQLDKLREIKWGPRAQMRNASLDRPVTPRMLDNKASRPYVVAAFIWAALVDRDHDLAGPEDIAEKHYLDTVEQQVAAWRAVNDMFAAEKKSQPSAATSVNGPSPSSTATPQSPTGGD
jgi:hypothetical protein